MKADVDKDPVKRKGVQYFRVVDADDPERKPILNRSGDPIDGGGHKLEGISRMLADETNEIIERVRKAP